MSEEGGGRVYAAEGPNVSEPLIPSELPAQFGELARRTDFLPAALTTAQRDKLAAYCSVEKLRGDLDTRRGAWGTACGGQRTLEPPHAPLQSELHSARRLRERARRDPASRYLLHLKYRSVRWPLPPVRAPAAAEPARAEPDEQEVLLHVRVYRPFYAVTALKQGGGEAARRRRGPAFCQELVVHGESCLSELRERILCPNDYGLRTDVSRDPDADQPANAKDLFPSGFFFIDNVFYNECGPGSVDYSAPIRTWAAARGLGELPARDMRTARFRDVRVRLGHPDVYVHQGNCEHLLTFSAVRLATAADAPGPPRPLALAAANTVYCMTCAEFVSKWVVVGSPRVAFDPAYFCDSCFREYNYVNGRKLGPFKAYPYYNKDSAL